MLNVRNLSVYFGDFCAVKNVSFHVKKGEIFGLLGANGAGKTTTIRVMCGLLTPTEGELQIGETLFGKENESVELIKSRIGYMSQKFTLYDDLTIEENWKFSASLRKLNQALYEKRRDHLSKWLSLDTQKKQLVGSLPSGLKQQVALAAALFHDPDIIFLDEPTAGVSPYARMQFWDLIKTLASEGKSIIVTTHYMDEAENCERLALMRAGEIIALDTPTDLKKTTFPQGVLRLNEDYVSEMLKTIFLNYQEKKWISFWPCGLNYHLVIHNENEWMKLKSQYPNLAHATATTPSLEDVFLELVEGRER